MSRTVLTTHTAIWLLGYELLLYALLQVPVPVPVATPVPLIVRSAMLTAEDAELVHTTVAGCLDP
jgi:hypothetical protein